MALSYDLLVTCLWPHLMFDSKRVDLDVKLKGLVWFLVLVVLA